MKPFRETPREAFLWLGVTAVHVGVLALERLGPPRHLLGDEALYRGAAEQLLATGTADLSPLWPPLQFLFLALLKSLGGGWWLVPWVQWSLLLLSAWLLYRMARRLVGDGPEARWAPILLLAYPPLVAFSQYYWPEVLHLALMLGLVELLLCASGSRLRLVVAGVLAGLAVATKALLMPWLPVFLLAAGWTRGRPWFRPELRAVAWFGLGLAATILPFMTWNAQRVGAFTLSSSAAFNLWIGLEETSNQSLVGGIGGPEYRTFLASGETFQERQAVLWGKIRRKVEQEGMGSTLAGQVPKQYLRLFDQETFFTDQLPPDGVIFQRGRGYRQRPGWLTDGLRGLSYGLYALLLVSGFFGWVVSDPSRHPWLRGVVLFVLFNLGLFLLLHVKSRFRIQLLPWMVLYGVVGLVWLRQALGESADRPRWSDLPRWRCWVGGVGTLLALSLAFGPF